MIPSKKSHQWIGIFISYILIVFGCMIFTRMRLSNEISGDILLRLFILSLVTAFFPCIVGYFGRKIFFLLYTLSVIAGILYMFYVVLGDVTPGWGDLTSMIGYLFIVIIGALISAITEIIVYYVKRKQK
jgi:hypothetical protein